jgi:GAF domain-containing protein
MSAEIIGSGEVYVSNDLASDARVDQVFAGLGAKSAIGVPLVAQNKALGVIWVHSNREIMFADVRLLHAVADMAANAIQRATLHELTEQRLQRMAALRAIDAAISGSLDLRVTLSVLLDQVVAQLGVDAADVLLVEYGSQRLMCREARGFRTRTVFEQPVSIGKGHAGRAALERHLVVVADTSEADGRCARHELTSREGFRAHHIAPLIVKGGVRGVLEVYSRSPHTPDAEWREFFEAWARPPLPSTACLTRTCSEPM